MRAHRDDERFEALLAGREAPDGDAAHLSALIERLRSETAGPVPRPSEALAAVLAEGALEQVPEPVATAVSPRAPRTPHRRIALITKPARRLAAKIGGLSLAAHIALGAGVALAGVGAAAGAAGVLPPGPPEPRPADPVSETFVLEVETGTAKSEFGKRVSDDAKGLDGTPGVDGQEISEEAKARFKPVSPGNQEHAPEGVPSGPPDGVPSGPPDDLPASAQDPSDDEPDGAGQAPDAKPGHAGPPAASSLRSGSGAASTGQAASPQDAPPAGDPRSDGR
ncbi:MAG TPA: hypothetical protein VML96_14000 [Egibacteraceae bacterium]|nr:hypothetical protein [Egibacteraceae bacterium]